MIGSKVLQPGSSEPADARAVDQLLTFVPELACLPCFEGCVPALHSAGATHEAVDAYFVGARLEPVIAALDELGETAKAETNGGLAFLVRTMLHFLQVETIAPSQHPLLVALYLRGAARAGGQPDSARAIANAMDRWS